VGLYTDHFKSQKGEREEGRERRGVTGRGERRGRGKEEGGERKGTNLLLLGDSGDACDGLVCCCN